MTTSPLILAAAMVLVTLAPTPSAQAQPPGPQPSAVVVRDAWVRTPPPSVPMTAGYLTIDNPTAEDVTLVSASSVVARRIELHEMRDENGRASMRMVDRIVVPARGTVKLAPGGLHLMIMSLPKVLVAGDEVPITLTMNDGTVAIARAVVKAAQ